MHLNISYGASYNCYIAPSSSEIIRLEALDQMTMSLDFYVFNIPHARAGAHTDTQTQTHTQIDRIYIDHVFAIIKHTHTHTHTP